MTISDDTGTMRGIGSDSEPDHDRKRGTAAISAGYCIEKGFGVVYGDSGRSAPTMTETAPPPARCSPTTASTPAERRTARTPSRTTTGLTSAPKYRRRSVTSKRVEHSNQSQSTKPRSMTRWDTLYKQNIANRYQVISQPNIDGFCSIWDHFIAFNVDLLNTRTRSIYRIISSKLAARSK